jgi:Tfp pilus assembly protein PilZ
MIMWEGVDKRQFPRIKHKCLMRVSDHGKDEIFDTYTENIGAGGICVVLSREFDLFKTASIELNVDDSGVPIVCKGTIVWVIRRRIGDSSDKYEYDIGVEFTDIAEDDRLKIEDLVGEVLGA